MKNILYLLIILSLVLFVTGCEKEKDLQETTKKEDTPSIEIVEDVSKEEDVVISYEEIKENNIIEESVTLNNEEEVITYFENIEQEVNSVIEEPLSDRITKKLKNTFITITDFLFYNGTIGGITFDQLSDETKVKVLEIAGNIDSKIESKLPGYKETIKTTTGKVYNSASTMIKSGITTLQEKIKEKISPDVYDTYQEGKESLKESFSNAGEKIVDVGKTIKDSVKSWYENFKNSK